MRYLMDTDVLVDALRGNPQAGDFLREHGEAVALSVLTVAELRAGVRNRREERQLSALLALFPKLEITERLAEKAGAYRGRYGKSHGTGLVDALLAATAEAERLTMVTLNRKHYPMLKTVKTPYRKH